MSTQLVSLGGQPRDEAVMGLFRHDRLPFDVFLLSEFSEAINSYITMYVAKAKDSGKQGPVNVVGMPLDKTIDFLNKTLL